MRHPAPLMLLTLLACAPDLRETWDWNNGDPIDSADTGPTDTEPGPCGPFAVNATSYDTWTPWQLATNTVVDKAFDSWDLAFQRYTIEVNGGASGTGGVEVAVVDNVPFADLTTAPETGWRTDEPDADGDGDLEFALGDWFDYDGTTHVVTAREGRVYVIRGVDGALYKLQMLSYYSEAGDSAVPSFLSCSLDTQE